VLALVLMLAAASLELEPAGEPQAPPHPRPWTRAGR